MRIFLLVVYVLTIVIGSYLGNQWGLNAESVILAGLWIFFVGILLDWINEFS